MEQPPKYPDVTKLTPEEVAKIRAQWMEWFAYSIYPSDYYVDFSREPDPGRIHPLRLLQYPPSEGIYDASPDDQD